MPYRCMNTKRTYRHAHTHMYTYTHTHTIQYQHDRSRKYPMLLQTGTPLEPGKTMVLRLRGLIRIGVGTPGLTGPQVDSAYEPNSLPFSCHYSFNYTCSPKNCSGFIQPSCPVIMSGENGLVGLSYTPSRLPVILVDSRWECLPIRSDCFREEGQ